MSRQFRLLLSSAFIMLPVSTAMAGDLSRPNTAGSALPSEALHGEQTTAVFVPTEGLLKSGGKGPMPMLAKRKPKVAARSCASLASIEDRCACYGKTNPKRKVKGCKIETVGFWGQIDVTGGRGHSGGSDGGGSGGSGGSGSGGSSNGGGGESPGGGEGKGCGKSY